MTINVSTAELRNPRYSENLFACLETHGVAPQHIRLELTESILAENVEKKQGLLHRLDEMDI